jgi:hypothetical protein
MNRRHVLIASVLALPLPRAWAHHGWSSFDQGRPIYLEGTVRKVAWRNPHVEFDLELPAELKLLPGLARRPVPAQSASVDGPKLFAAAQLPTRRDRVWHIELAPLTRVQDWKVAELKNGDKAAMVGFTFAAEKGDPVLRVEYLFIGERTYGMRSSPA